MKKIIYRMFHISRILGIFICVFSAILLIYVFSTHIEYTPLAYFSYLFSTYALILFVIEFVKACQFSSDFIKETKVYLWYKSNELVILKNSLMILSLFNFAYGILNLVTGIYYNSWLFITLSIYYLTLCIMRSLLLKNISVFGENLDDEYKKLKNTGIILLLLNIVLGGIIIMFLHQDYHLSYSRTLIYLIAMYDFYLIISAFINVLKHKKNKSPVISASKCISLTVAMICILSLEVTMIYEFGENDNEFKFIMTSITGFVICLINTIMSIMMIYKGKRKI